MERHLADPPKDYKKKRRKHSGQNCCKKPELEGLGGAQPVQLAKGLKLGDSLLAKPALARSPQVWPDSLVRCQVCSRSLHHLHRGLKMELSGKDVQGGLLSNSIAPCDIFRRPWRFWGVSYQHKLDGQRQCQTKVRRHRTSGSLQAGNRPVALLSCEHKLPFRKRRTTPRLLQRPAGLRAPRERPQSCATWSLPTVVAGGPSVILPF